MKKLALLLSLCAASSVLAQNPEEYKSFQQSIEKIVNDARDVTQTPQEQSDLRILEWHLRDLKGQIAAKNWWAAEITKKKMNVALQRSSLVASDATNRKAERERAEQERRHQEVLNQNERHHRELMNQQQQMNNQIRLQQIINQSRAVQSQPKPWVRP